MRDNMLTELEKVINARRRIYLLRHGEVSYFDSSGNPYHPEEVPLNEVGRTQATAAGEALGKAAVDLVVTSGLPRTLQTAQLALGQMEADCEPESIGELREIMPGDAFKSTEKGADLAFADSMRKSLTRDTEFLGGETFGSLEDRVAPAFEALAAREDWTELLLVAHGGTNRMILSKALGGGLETFGRLEQDAGCINIIDLDADGTCLLRLINYTPGSPVKDGMRRTTMEEIYMTSLLPKRDAPATEEDN
jgi:probable phosphoglycerate mutase